MLHSVELFPNLLEKNWKLNFIKLIRKCVDVRDR